MRSIIIHTNNPTQPKIYFVFYINEYLNIIKEAFTNIKKKSFPFYLNSTTPIHTITYIITV